MLFDKNGIYLVNDDDYNFAIDIMNGNFNKNRPDNYIGKKDNFKLYDLEESLEKGNAFKSLYDPYKGYKQSLIKMDNARDRALLEIQMLDFTINDLNLYLDLHPEDKEAYNLFKCYVEECKKKKENYSNIYGPLTLDQVYDEYEWSKGVWPWEEGMM